MKRKCISNCASNHVLDRDAALYALGIGACASDAVDEDELKYVYHEDGQKAIKVLFIFKLLVKWLL